MDRIIIDKNRLNSEFIGKINEFINAAFEKKVKGEILANIDQGALTKQIKAEVSKQIAPYIKKGVDDFIKRLIDKTIDETIEEYYVKHKKPRKRLPIEY